MEEGEDALDLAALATAFRASNEVQSGRHAHMHTLIHTWLSTSSTPHKHPPTQNNNNQQVFRAILKSEVLREAISDLADLPGASTVRLHVSDQAPHFHLASGGTFSSLDLFLPRTSEARGYLCLCVYLVWWMVGGCREGW